MREKFRDTIGTGYADTIGTEYVDAIGTGYVATRLQCASALRTLIVALTVVSVVVPVFLFYSRHDSEHRHAAVRPTLTTNAFSGDLDRQELKNAVTATRAAYQLYLRRDVTAQSLSAVFAEFDDGSEFSTISSHADLLRTFQLLATNGGDKYMGVVPSEFYRDYVERVSGAEIKVDVFVEWKPDPEHAFVLTRVGPEAGRQGLQVNDRLVELDGTRLADLGMPVRVASRCNEIMSEGLLGSSALMTISRPGWTASRRFTVERTVARRSPAFVVTDMQHPIADVPMPDVKVVEFNHLRAAGMLTDLYQVLTRLEKAHTRGILVDVRKVVEGDPEIGVRVAAMFSGNGALGSVISTTGSGALMIKKYAIVDRKVQVKTRGPFNFGADGVLSSVPANEDETTITDWPCDVYTGQVIGLSGRETSGAGEVIAAVFKNSWNSNKGRTQLLSKQFPAGKGTGQTFFPIGERYWLRLSTSYWLQPEGAAIEDATKPGLGVAPNLPCQPEGDEHWFARLTLFRRMSVMPHSSFPADRP